MQRHAEVREAYQRVGALASRYDGMMTNSSFLGRLALRWLWGLSEEDYAEYIHQAFAGIPVGFDGKLLEVPVGTGALSLPVYQDLPQADITCLDYAEGMLEHARMRAAQMHLSHIRFVQGDVGRLSFPDASYDVVLSVNGLHAFPDKAAAFRETQRVLKKGGRFCGCVYIKGVNPITDIFVRTFCTYCGYFTPPFDTFNDLQRKMQELYREVHMEKTGPFACFICQK